MALDTIPATNNEHARMFHQKLRGIIVFAIIVILIVVGYLFLTQQHSLSEKDFVTVEQKMDGVYANMSSSDVDKAKVCYYYKDSMGKVLICGIEMVGYVTLKGPDDLSAAANVFSEQLKLMSSTNTNDFWRITSDGQARDASFVVKDSPVNMGCMASVGGKDSNRVEGRSLPKRDLTGKAALTLMCGGASLEPYFDMQANSQ